MYTRLIMIISIICHCFGAFFRLFSPSKGILTQILVFLLHEIVLQAVADIIRTTLGPRSMLKMLLDAGGGTLFSLPYNFRLGGQCLMLPVLY